MSSVSRTPSLTPSRSPSPEPPVQPDHFYGAEAIQLPPSPDSNGKTWLDPADDPLAHRGVPVFKPSMEEFKDFEAYMTKVECWGARSGIIKVIPPKEWTAALPPLKQQLRHVKIKTPIEQHMLGRSGLFRQENMEKRKIMSVREWVELCTKDEFRAPGIDEVGLHTRSANVKPRTKKTKKKADTVKAESVGLRLEDIEEPADDVQMLEADASVDQRPHVASPPHSVADSVSPTITVDCDLDDADAVPAETEIVSEDKPKPLKNRRTTQTREAREASLADRAFRDMAFLETFDPHADWLPLSTKAADYTPEFCQKLERQYWRNCGLGRPAWYGADTQGSLYTDETTSWNVAHLHSTLSRLLPSSDQGLPGVNTPYLYFGMWRATFAWHVEDMDLFSINYIHFGAPKFWYAIPQGRAGALEQTMRGYFPKDTSTCPQFLRHKSFLASPTLLAQSSCRPNYLVQHAGEFVVTFPRGYHAGFNLGINCAESVNFALDSWLELGRRAKACECINDSVRIDVDQLLMDRAMEAANPAKLSKTKRSSSKKENDNKDNKPKRSHKRKSEGGEDTFKAKKIRIVGTSSSTKVTPHKLSITLKLGPRPVEPEFYPCCLCVSTNKDGLLRVFDPPVRRRDAADAAGNPKEWMAHEYCASVVPETWVDVIEPGRDGVKEKVVFGVDGIVRDRWNLKCSACTKNRPKAHGAPIQCTKGKCPKAFHVSCAREGEEAGILFTVIKEVEKEVVLLDPAINGQPASSDQVLVNPSGQPEGAHSMNTEPGSGSRVLKIIKKLEVQALCIQHNPIVAAAKKANKQDKIKADLMALPSMARIKIRVSAGVFEVSLIRVIEEASSVEVLWDRGIKREFKWGSVVFGSTDGPVQQKPSELAPGPEATHSSTPVTALSSVLSASANHVPAKVTQSAHRPPTTIAKSQPGGKPAHFLYPPRAGPYEYWGYQAPQYAPSTQLPHPYAYTGYYPSAATMGGPSPHFNAFAYNQNQFLPSQLHWQQPYHGRHPGDTKEYHDHTQQPTAQNHGPAQEQTTPTPAAPEDGQAVLTDPRPGEPAAVPLVKTTQTSDDPVAAVVTPNLLSAEVQMAFQNLAALSSLHPSQITNFLRDNPQLRDVFLAAVGQGKVTAPS